MATQRKTPFRNTTKSSIKTKHSSLLNTDLGNLNDSNLILKNDRLSIYNTIYIFLKFTCRISKKTKTYPVENKSNFSKPKIWLVQLKEGFWVFPAKAYSNRWSQTPNHDCKLVQNYKLFCSSNAFMIRSMIILTFIVCSNLSALRFKFKGGPHVIIYHSSLDLSLAEEKVC